MFNTGKIYLHKILYVEHCGKIYLHKIVRNTVRWKLWEDLFTQNTEEYCMLNTMRQYSSVLCLNKSSHSAEHKVFLSVLCQYIFPQWSAFTILQQNTEEYCMLNTMRRFIYRKYWGILYVEHCGKIYLHKYWGILYVQYSSVFCVNKSSQCWTYSIPQYCV
jgi:hypothetical protein